MTGKKKELNKWYTQKRQGGQVTKKDASKNETIYIQDL